MTAQVIRTGKRPTRKHWTCGGSSAGKVCFLLRWSERAYGPAGAALMCADPYVPGNKAHQTACQPTKGI